MDEIKQDDEPQVVWHQTVDRNVWWAKVTRVDNYKGRLQVGRVSDDEIILDEEVGLAYQAIFGPDVDDVALWQEKTIEAIDSRKEADDDDS
jgi:hypothetical protein